MFQSYHFQPQKKTQKCPTVSKPAPIQSLVHQKFHMFFSNLPRTSTVSNHDIHDISPRSAHLLRVHSKAKASENEKIWGKQAKNPAMSWNSRCFKPSKLGEQQQKTRKRSQCTSHNYQGPSQNRPLKTNTSLGPATELLHHWKPNHERMLPGEIRAKPSQTCF